ncbi:hypothetical protein GCM10008083_27320 [Ulvibacter litoralis]|nr:hypothetical protein GCM10008083_27320 [Ulvibacter litoralis]
MNTNLLRLTGLKYIKVDYNKNEYIIILANEQGLEELKRYS